MKNILFYILILIILNSCGKYKPKDDIEVKIDSSKAVIFDCNLTDKWGKRVFSETQNAIITADDLLRIEATLKIIIAKQNIKQQQYFEYCSMQFPEENYKKEDFIIHLNDYKKQYIAILNSKAEKVIWINLFSSNIIKQDNFDWKKRILKSYGGGANFFNFKINITRKQCYDVWFNAEA